MFGPGASVLVDGRSFCLRRVTEDGRMILADVEGNEHEFGTRVVAEYAGVVVTTGFNAAVGMCLHIQEHGVRSGPLMMVGYTPGGTWTTVERRR